MEINILFKLALRQIEPWDRPWSERPWRGGRVASRLKRTGLLKRAGLDWAVPDYTTLCRRQKTLAARSAVGGLMGR